ncbi:hypothetical protein BDW42DRAFT_179703, partial [Aspergillus taichungensis]
MIHHDEICPSTMLPNVMHIGIEDFIYLSLLFIQVSFTWRGWRGISRKIREI